MISGDLPLLDLFNQLRQHGLPLGVDDYTLLLRAVQAGFGMGDQHALKRLCCTLWIKSEQEKRLFERLYTQNLVDALPPSQPEQSVPPLPETDDHQSIENLSELMETDFPSKPEEKLSHPPRLLPEDEPTQVAQAVRRTRTIEDDLSRPRINPISNFFPLTRRNMKQSWRHLRRMVRKGPLEELDVNATIEKIASIGFLAELVLLPSLVNSVNLILLIDQDGSMVPFHALTCQLVETAHRDRRLGKAGVYYFHDYPNSYVYFDATRLKAKSLTDLFSSLDEQTVMLIISDAGAARGRYDSERINKTSEFLHKLQKNIIHFAWINPMPKNRWANCTAETIAKMIPMFELNRQGFDSAISALRGQYLFSYTQL